MAIDFTQWRIRKVTSGALRRPLHGRNQNVRNAARHNGQASRALEPSRQRSVLRSGAYGRAILNDVQVRLERDVAAGAVHVTLVRLEGKGLLSSYLGPGTEVRAGRPCRYYRLNPSGVRALNDARAAVHTLWRGVKWPLKGHA